MNWITYLPPGESQLSDIAPTNQRTDTLACVSYSAVHCIESQIRFLTGQAVEYSERALAKLSDTTHNGNSAENVINAIKKYGLILDKDWPEPTGYYTWEDYYVPIPLEIIAAGQNFLRQYDIGIRTYNLDISIAPYWTEIDLGSDTHFVEQLNPDQYFDSYQLYVKRFDQIQPYGQNHIINQFQLIIKPKTMSNAIFVHKKATGEYGFYLPALSEDALKDKALNTGINILNPDGSINYASAKEIDGL